MSPGWGVGGREAGREVAWGAKHDGISSKSNSILMLSICEKMLRHFTCTNSCNPSNNHKGNKPLLFLFNE